jgi:ABC-type Na+ transport system ATPase subunit NatA
MIYSLLCRKVAKGYFLVMCNATVIIQVMPIRIGKWSKIAQEKIMIARHLIEQSLSIEIEKPLTGMAD